MIKHLQASWDALARRDAMWAVLTDDDKAGGAWDESAFFATGIADIEAILNRLAQLDAQPKFARALDFGCGVGRLTRALAQKFDRVDGVDVSATMLAKAQSIPGAPSNAHFVHNVRRDLALLPSNAYSFILSLISLQHMPGNLALNYVKEFCRLLEVEGVAYLQMSTFLDPTQEVARAKLSRDESRLNLLYRAFVNLFRRREPGMGTYYCRLSEIINTLERQRTRVIAILPDQSLPAPFLSHVVIFKRVVGT